MDKTITQEEIEKAWQDYAKEIGLPESLNYATKSMIEIAIKQAFKAGAKINGKQENDAEDTVIQGWVARNGSGPNDLGLHVYSVKPDRMKNRREWNGHGEMSYLIDCRLFTDLTWESDPIKVEIIIKRKKKNL